MRADFARVRLLGPTGAVRLIVNEATPGGLIRPASEDSYAAAATLLRRSGFAADVRSLRLSVTASAGVVAVYVDPGDSRIEWTRGQAGMVPSRHLFRLEGRPLGAVSLFSGSSESDLSTFLASLTAPIGRELLPLRRPALEWDPHQAEVNDFIDLHAYLAMVEAFQQVGL